MKAWLIMVGMMLASAAQAQTVAYRTTPAPALGPAIALPAPPSPRAEIWGELWGRAIVRDVTGPRLIEVAPRPGTASGAAVVVAPGGGFDYLAVEDEGLAPARWLADHGIAAFVLIYRTHDTPADPAAFLAHMAAFEPFEAAHRGDVPVPPEPEAGEDALSALSYLRAHAAELGIDPQRLGMMGFSAGAITTMMAATAPDAAARPAFIGYVYGPMRTMTVPADAPPMFAAIALNDELFGRQGLGLIEAWRAAGRPVEFHGYESGGHGFGIGRPGQTNALLMDEWLAWLRERGVMGR